MSPIVFIHGATSDESVWDEQIQALHDYPSSAVDLKDFASIESMAEKVLSSAPEKFILCGTSMGGYVALHVASKAPERVEKLVLCNTNARADTNDRKQNRQIQIDAGADAFKAAHDEQDYYRNFLAEDSLSADLMARMKKVSLSVGFNCFVRHQTACMNRQNKLPFLSEIRIPSLIIGGAEDRVAPVEQQLEMAGLIPKSEIVIFPACGHLAHWEKKVEFKKVLSSFISQNGK